MLVQSGWFFRKFAVFRFPRRKEKELSSRKNHSDAKFGSQQLFFTQVPLHCNKKILEKGVAFNFIEINFSRF